MIMKWRIKNQPDEDLVQSITQILEIPPILAKLLVVRGIKDAYSAELFIHPNMDDPNFSPYRLKDIEKAANRIIQSLKNNETIVIYGDYDADGITAAALLYNFLEVYQYHKKQKVNVKVIIPDRLEDGYGLRIEGVSKCKEQGADLIITVDNGITSVEAAEEAKKEKIDLIITDHHEVAGDIPDAIAVVNPKQRDCPYPFKDLAGVGVVYKLVSVLCDQLFDHDLKEKFLSRYMDLVAIGTYQDVVPILEENRWFIINGLKTINALHSNEIETNKEGLKHLILAAGYKNKQIVENTLGYIIGPRINAGGRMLTSKEENAFELLTRITYKEKDRKISQNHAKKLNDLNTERRSLQKKYVAQAHELIRRRNLVQDKILIIASKYWEIGIIGLVASNLKDYYNLPTVILTVADNNEEYVGSCRSLHGFSMIDALTQCQEYLKYYGGHQGAAGFTIEVKHYDAFKEKLIAIAKEHFQAKPFEKILDIDLEISFKDITPFNHEAVKKMSPFGEKNENPIFICKEVEIVSMRRSKRGVDTLFTFKQKNHTIDMVIFNNDRYLSQYSLGDVLDIALCFDYNSNSNDRLTSLIDIRLSNPKRH